MTYDQWEEILPLYTGMRNCTWSKQELTDTGLYLVNLGCKWGQLSCDFPLYLTVRSFYHHARMSGLWDNILEHLVKKTRTNAGHTGEKIGTMVTLDDLEDNSLEPLNRQFGNSQKYVQLCQR